MKLDRRTRTLVLLKRNKAVFKNENECWLDTNYSTGIINEDQHFAGIRFRSYYERTEGKIIVSYNIDRVDYGSGYLSSQESKLNALDKLKIIEKQLGKRDYQIVRLHCGLGYNYSEIGKKINSSRQTIAKNMKMALNNLFDVFSKNVA